eukprot:CAMPEP_0185261136 /NCGR_PEP_ID=MMETSP1359-20130426/9588_1 /TAXON_ID=552665 /ORGANISM="Bigelowiella longifila, Strain CCMP242" /LENGTH=328 /DNA_ID=CAMNT_0027847643 /DNA_START=247 /DNA_END=1233 /DNA_ORIENTATION=+
MSTRAVDLITKVTIWSCGKKNSISLRSLDFGRYLPRGKETTFLELQNQFFESLSLRMKEHMKDFRPVHRAIVQANHLVCGQREREEKYDKEAFILEKKNEQMRIIIRISCALVLAYFDISIAVIIAVIIFLVGEGMCRLKWLRKHHHHHHQQDEDPRVKLRHKVASISEVDSSYWTWKERKHIPNGLEGITLQHFLTTATEEMRKYKFDLSDKKLAMKVMRLFWRSNNNLKDTTTATATATTTTSTLPTTATTAPTMSKSTSQDKKQAPSSNIGGLTVSSPKCAPPSPPQQRKDTTTDNNTNNNKSTTRRRSSQQQIAEALNFVHIGF